MEEISSKITEWLIKQQVIQRDDMEIYQYGLFHMIMNLADIISIILISLYFGKIELAVIYLVFFCVLRKYAGGYHAKTIVGCYIITLSTVTLMFGVVNYWNTSLSSMIWVWVIVSLNIFILAPVQSQNKKLDEMENLVYRRRALAIWVVESSIMWIFYGLGMRDISKAILVNGIIVSASMDFEKLLYILRVKICRT